MGKLPKASRRSTQIQIRISSRDLALIRRAAKLLGQTVSEFIRTSAFKHIERRSDRG